MFGFSGGELLNTNEVILKLGDNTIHIEDKNKQADRQAHLRQIFKKAYELRLSCDPQHTQVHNIMRNFITAYKAVHGHHLARD